MALTIDDRALDLITRRRRSGKDATPYLRLQALKGRAVGGPNPYQLVIGWYAHPGPHGTLVERQIGNVIVCIDERVARFAETHDIPIGAWHVGPIRRLAVSNMLGMEIADWLQRQGPVREQRTAA